MLAVDRSSAYLLLALCVMVLVSTTEGVRRRPGRRSNRSEMKLWRMFKELDSDGDRRLSEAEIANVDAEGKQLFADADKNKDKFVDVREYRDLAKSDAQKLMEEEKARENRQKVAEAKAARAKAIADKKKADEEQKKAAEKAANDEDDDEDSDETEGMTDQEKKAYLKEKKKAADEAKKEAEKEAKEAEKEAKEAEKEQEKADKEAEKAQ